MTVTELRDALNALIDQGYGELPVVYGYGVPGVVEWGTVDRVRFEEDGDENFPGPRIELE